jgi:hypothetical protein
MQPMEHRNTYQARWLCHLALALLAALTAWQLNGCTGPGSGTYAPLWITHVSPQDGAVEVPINASITVRFSEPIDPATLTPETFTLYTGNTRVAGSAGAANDIAVFFPSDGLLLPNTVYTAKVTTGIKDFDGFPLSEGRSWTFTTGTAIAWVKTYSGATKAVQTTLDGGYVVAGNWGSGYASVLSLDAVGGSRWHKVYGTSNSLDLNTVQQTQDGGYIAGGSAYRSAGGADLWVLKLNSDGDIVWQKAYGTASGCNNDHHEAWSVQQTVEGGYIVTGRVESCGLDSVWILKLDDTGNVVWQKSYGGGEGRSIQRTANGGYVVTGNTFSATTPRDLLVLRLDSLGNIVWQKAYSGTYNGNPNVFEKGYSIQQTMDGGYVVSGYTRAVSVTGSSGSDAWVLRLDASGEIIWQKAYGDYRDGRDEAAVSVRQTGNGDYIVAGYGLWTGNVDYWLFRLDASGKLSWQKAYGDHGHNYATSLQLTADDGYILAGNNEGASGGTTVIKLPPDGSSEAALKDTDVVPRTSDALATDTGAIPTDTNAVVTDTSAEAQSL